MMQRRSVFSLFAAAIGNCIVFKANAVESQPQVTQTHVAWVAKVLEHMQIIKPGATRQALLTVFTTEGGLSTGLKRTFVSQDCPYFKVDVDFRAVGRSNRNEDGRVTLVEGNEDVIVKISPPYLQFTVLD
jgi:hypothetical protein